MIFRQTSGHHGKFYTLSISLDPSIDWEVYVSAVKIPKEEDRKEQAQILSAYFEACPFNCWRFIMYAFLETLNVVNVALQVSFLVHLPLFTL